ncbi:MAG TPA: hypothetical protein VHD90_13500 [Phototrophicaceae bacterium]|nr:hypothetical protein [Phototrophicaceae bacterium]
MAITDGETLKKQFYRNPDEALRILDHDLSGMLSVIHGGAALLSEDLQQPEADVQAKLETIQQVAELVLHEAMRAQEYLDELRAAKIH